MDATNTAIARLERSYNLAISAEESAVTLEEAQRLAVKSQRCLTQLRLAKAGKLPPVAKKVARKLERMVASGTYAQVVEFVSTHHYGGCACGCGAAVAKLFKQGHDMKLKSRMRHNPAQTPTSTPAPADSPAYYVMSADAYRIPGEPEVPAPASAPVPAPARATKPHHRPFVRRDYVYNFALFAMYLVFMFYKLNTFQR